MHPENLEIIRDLFDVFNRGDVDAILASIPEEFELDFSRAIGPYAGVYRLQEALDVYQAFSENWASLRFEAGDLIEADERVVVPITVHVEGRDGIVARARATWVVTIRDGAVVHVDMFQEHQGADWPGRREALEAVGLSE